MKYLPLEKFEAVTNALNFSTADLHVIGGCDVYTTKAAGRDKKLYRDIDSSLEAQYQSLVRLSASLSPPYRPSPSSNRPRRRSATVESPEINLSRDSPFGPLSQPSSRRTFAYLIATLNAAHPDYDFSHILKPQDFHHERSLKSVMHHVDSTLQNLRPRYQTPYLSPPLLSSSASVTNAFGNEVWSPRMWSLIDTEMGLADCEKYSYMPDEDPFADDDGGSIWNMHYFFFNPERKRVCYLYLRGLSVISHSPVSLPIAMSRKHVAPQMTLGDGSGKRANYWLGSVQRVSDDRYEYDDDDDDADMIIPRPDDDEVDVRDVDPDQVRAALVDGYYPESGDELDDPMELWDGPMHHKHVRGMSEEIGDAMDI